MNILREFGRRLSVLLKQNRAGNEIDEEMQFHLEMLAKEKEDEGLRPEEAAYAARREFGNPGELKERSWDAWGWSFLDRFCQDLRHALRSMLHSPLQTMLIIASLGLAMGAVLAVFASFDKLLPRTLPVVNPNELVYLSAPQLPPRIQISGGANFGEKKFVIPIDYPSYKTLQNRAHCFQEMSAFTSAGAKVTIAGEPVSARGYAVSGNYFPMLGVKAMMGRMLAPSDDNQGDRIPAIILSHSFWRRSFNEDRSILQKTIYVNNRPMIVTGIAPRGFRGTNLKTNADFFVSISQAHYFRRMPGFRFDAPGYDFYTMLARLAPGIDISKAQQSTEKIYQSLLSESGLHRPSNAEEAIYHVALFPGGYGEPLSGRMKKPLSLLMALVMLVLIVAVGNVANLLLAKRIAGARSIAIRLALGSSRWRVLRELLMESFLLSGCAAVIACMLAFWTAHLVPFMFSDEAAVQGSIDFDLRMKACAAALAIAIGICIWGASAIRATMRSQLPSIVEAAPAGAAPRAICWRRTMVILQISFSLLLLCSSFVLCRSLMKLGSIDPGFSTQNLYGATVEYGDAAKTDRQKKAFQSQFVDLVRSLPGVQAAALTDIVPILANGANIRNVNDRPITQDNEGTRAFIMCISPAYFRTMSIPLLAGREFTPADASHKLAIVNQRLASIRFGASNPIGKRVWVEGSAADAEIVGIVRNTKTVSLRDDDFPAIYLLASQERSYSEIGIVLRTSGPAISSNALRSVIKSIDPSAKVDEFGSAGVFISESLSHDRAWAFLSLGFACLASILCSIGVFGLTSYSISGRTQEIGVRIALGARSGLIYRLVMKEIVALSIIGCGLGLAGFAAIGRLLTSLLYQVKAADPLSLVWAMLGLAAITFLAAYIPSRRAARMDPSIALRWE